MNNVLQLTNSYLPIITPTPIIHLVICLITLGITYYILIFLPQREIMRHRILLANTLKVGCTVILNNGKTGKVFQLLQRTLIVEIEYGEKIEILKQNIQAIQDESS